MVPAEMCLYGGVYKGVGVHLSFRNAGIPQTVVEVRSPFVYLRGVVICVVKVDIGE